MKTSIEILNLKCGGCANSIKKGISDIENIDKITVDLENSRVIFETNDEQNVEKVKTKLSKMGYPPVGEENTLVHKAKSFVSCATGRLTNEME